ncbi:protein ILRUN [Nilaparvata lugens]|uniref:protein ILRUN n=1 Tax=Nilaparvata lugens TaxID=108931 RepID=UPI00193E5341|nr:protein ILRUN [Nilaparvata lugens]
MDVDFDNDPVDQNLLQLFSCMGTTDKDELVKQMQKLVGDNMNATTASFFLDMNNWNLQAAVCSYFDFEHSLKLPSMSLVRDELSDQILEYPPGTIFRRVWQVQNTGEESWPLGCHLQWAGGDSLDGTRERIAVPPLTPCACANIASAEITAPLQPGIYKTKFRVATPSGAYFGDIIWMIVTVSDAAEAMTNELADQLSHLNALGNTVGFPSTNPANPFSANPNANANSHLQDSLHPGSNDNMC